MSSPLKQDDVCVVCCRNNRIYAVGPCDHPVCFICSSRMRVLCLKNECPICRQDMPKVIFTKTEHSYSVLSTLNYRMDHKFKICFADEEIEEEYFRLLEECCPVCPNKQCFRSFGHMKDHLRKQHEMFYCDLCVDHLKLFTFERRSYSRKDWARHQRIGDPEDTSHKGHPLCKYCEQRYVDKDDLYRHLRRDHYYCHFCDADGINNAFYPDYTMLYAHFREEHFVCEEGSCQEDRYTGVFRSDIDLIAHKAANHSRNLTKHQAKQARTLELNFSIASRHHHPHNGNMLGESERDGYNRRGGRRGPNSSHGPNERDLRTEMTMIFPERESPVPEPEAVIINMQCERDFPHLNTAAGPSNISIGTENQRPTKNQGGAKPTKWKGPMKSYEDDFPSLTTSGTSSAPRNKLLVQFKNQDHSMPHQNTSNISIKLSNKPKMVDFGKQSTNMPQTTLTISQTSRPLQNAANNHTPKSFEQHFPRLEGTGNVRTTVTVPIWKKQEEHKLEPSKSPEFTVVSSKNRTKKKTEKLKVVVQPEPKANDVKERKKEKRDSPVESANSVQISSNSISSNNEELRTPTEDLIVNTSSSVDGAKELQEKTLKLVMEDFPALEPVTNSKGYVPPGFQNVKESKKAQPPPGFVPSKPNITLSLSSVANELTMQNGNNNTNCSTFATNNCNSSFAMTPSYLEPQNFQVRNQNLIQEIVQVLKNNMPVFNQFKTLSGQFRQGQILPTEYYDKCIELFGKENFNKILPELLVLLPDITKQQELLSIYNKCKKKDGAGSGAVPKNGSWNVPNMQFMVCASCQQVLCNRDFRDHMASHSDDFPSLVQPNRTAAQISWVKK